MHLIRFAAIGLIAVASSACAITRAKTGRSEAPVSSSRGSSAITSEPEPKNHGQARKEEVHQRNEERKEAKEAAKEEKSEEKDEEKQAKADDKKGKGKGPK